jgi:hypothetical protein
VDGPVAEAFFGDAAFGEFFAELFANAVFGLEADGFFFAEPLD